MRLFARIIVATIANAVGLYAATRFISGFEINPQNFEAFFAIAATLMILNFFLKPILKLILGPLIILTFGLGLILVNAIVLKILDILFEDLTILTIPSLLWASVLIGTINFVFHLAQNR